MILHIFIDIQIIQNLYPFNKNMEWTSAYANVRPEDLLYMTENAYTLREFHEMQREMIATLGVLDYPDPFDFGQEIIDQEYGWGLKPMMGYIMMSSFAAADEATISLLPSLMVVASYYLAAELWDKSQLFNPTLTFGYSMPQVLQTVELLKKNVLNTTPTIRRLYESSQIFRASRFIDDKLQKSLS
jgi:hypothetical protein